MRKGMTIGVAVLAGVFSAAPPSAQAQRDSLRTTERLPVSLRLASTSPTRGFETIRVGDQTLYVSSRGALSGADVVSATSIDTRNGSDVEMSLTSAASDRLAGAMRTLGVTHVVVFANGKLVGAGAVELDARAGRAVVSSLSSAQAQRVTSLLNTKRRRVSGPTITMTASQAVIPPGGSTRVDVFLTGAVADLRAFQVSLKADGGDTGQVNLGDLTIDDRNAEFVFSGLDKLDAVDASGRRLAATLFAGGVDVATRAYLGSFTVTASSDASGAFQVGLKDRQSTTMLLSSANEPIPFAPARPLVITVGGRTPTDR